MESERLLCECVRGLTHLRGRTITSYNSVAAWFKFRNKIGVDIAVELPRLPLGQSPTSALS